MRSRCRRKSTAERKRFVFNLVSELVRLGHELTLFTIGDSQAPCKIEAVFPTALRATEPYASDAKMREAAKYLGISRVLKKLDEADFDLVHNHLSDNQRQPL